MSRTSSSSASGSSARASIASLPIVVSEVIGDSGVTVRLSSSFDSASSIRTRRERPAARRTSSVRASNPSALATIRYEPAGRESVAVPEASAVASIARASFSIMRSACGIPPPEGSTT